MKRTQEYKIIMSKDELSEAMQAISFLKDTDNAYNNSQAKGDKLKAVIEQLIRYEKVIVHRPSKRK